MFILPRDAAEAADRASPQPSRSSGRRWTGNQNHLTQLGNVRQLFWSSFGGSRSPRCACWGPLETHWSVLRPSCGRLGLSWGGPLGALSALSSDHRKIDDVGLLGLLKSKKASRRLQIASRRLKTAPRRLQEGPRGPEEGPRAPPEAKKTKTAQERPKTAQERPPRRSKRPSRRPKRTPREPEGRPKTAPR